MLPRLVAAFFVIALGQMSGQAEKLAPGIFLVASRDLGDPNFARAVVLLLHYDDENGALGLIINRQTDVPLSRVFAELKEAKGRADPIYVGGPVETGSVLALLKSASKPKDAEPVFGDVYLISSKTLLAKTLADGVEASQFHAYLGYAGWGREQLEHEVGLGAWHVLPADAGNVFHSDPDSVWQRLIRRTEVRIARSLRQLPNHLPLPNQAVQGDLAVVDH
jgi:putative transcriptional regulator